MSYRRQPAGYYLWATAAHLASYITQEKGVEVPPFWSKEGQYPGEYAPTAPATGTATVTAV